MFHHLYLSRDVEAVLGQCPEYGCNPTLSRLVMGGVRSCILPAFSCVIVIDMRCTVLRVGSDKFR